MNRFERLLFALLLFVWVVVLKIERKEVSLHVCQICKKVSLQIRLGGNDLCCDDEQLKRIFCFRSRSRSPVLFRNRNHSRLQVVSDDKSNGKFDFGSSSLWRDAVSKGQQIHAYASSFWYRKFLPQLGVLPLSALLVSSVPLPLACTMRAPLPSNNVSPPSPTTHFLLPLCRLLRHLDHPPGQITPGLPFPSDFTFLLLLFLLPLVVIVATTSVVSYRIVFRSQAHRDVPARLIPALLDVFVPSSFKNKRCIQSGEAQAVRYSACTISHHGPLLLLLLLNVFTIHLNRSGLRSVSPIVRTD